MEMHCITCQELKDRPVPLTRPAALVERPARDPATTASRTFECRECGQRWLWNAGRGWRPNDRS